MILLLETCPKIRVENSGKKLFLEGIYISCSKPTANRRRYLPETVERAVADAIDKIRNQQMFGMLGHPRDSGGDLSRVSHVVKSLTRKGSDWIGRSEVISEGAGKVLRSIIEATGGRGIGMSTRSIGEVQNKGGENVVTSMVLLGVDAVESAAGVGCFGRAVYENLQQNAYSLNESFIATQLLKEVASQDTLHPNSRYAATKDSTKAPSPTDNINYFDYVLG
jgi:Prohead core protein serine protease